MIAITLSVGMIAASLLSGCATTREKEEAGAIYESYIEDFTNLDGTVNWLPICATGDGMVANQELFEEYRPRNIEYAGQADGDIVTLDYKFVSGDDRCYVQIAKKGGMLISFNTSPSGDESVAIVEASETCQQNALRFASRVGFENMMVVWSSSADGECVINLAPVQNGAILYPDLVKVKVREDDLRVIGFDSTHYAFNHRERTLDEPTISVADAQSTLSVEAISEGRLALIPLRETREVLTYEFECHSDGTYYVYIDAQTGEEVNILYVISDDAGMRTA